MKKIGVLLALSLTACASVPQFGDQDVTALKPDFDAYHSCLDQQTAQMINGSNNVDLLTRVILGACDTKLQPISDYLRGRGFSSLFVYKYVHNTREAAGNAVAANILHVKSVQASSQDAPSSPAPQ